MAENFLAEMRFFLKHDKYQLVASHNSDILIPQRNSPTDR